MCQPQDDEHQTMSGKQIKTNKLERVVLKDDQHCYRLKRQLKILYTQKDMTNTNLSQIKCRDKMLLTTKPQFRCTSNSGRKTLK
jgi:hypothetical protein